MANVFFKAAIAVMREKNWRFSYGKHVLHNVALSCRSTTDCVEVRHASLFCRLFVCVYQSQQKYFGTIKHYMVFFIYIMVLCFVMDTG